MKKALHPLPLFCLRKKVMKDKLKSSLYYKRFICLSIIHINIIWQIFAFQK